MNICLNEARQFQKQNFILHKRTSLCLPLCVARRFQKENIQTEHDLIINNQIERKTESEQMFGVCAKKFPV